MNNLPRIKDKGKLWNPKILRRILALFFLCLISFLFIWSLKEDYRLKYLGNIFRNLHRTGLIHYTIQLKSFNSEDQVVKGSLSVGPGLLPPAMWLPDPSKGKKETVPVYGPLSYEDLSLRYAFGTIFNIFPFKKYTPEKSFLKSHPSPMRLA